MSVVPHLGDGPSTAGGTSTHVGPPTISAMQSPDRLLEHILRPKRVLVACDDPVEADTIQAGLAARLAVPISIADLDAVRNHVGDSPILVLGVDPSRLGTIVPYPQRGTIFLLVEAGQVGPWSTRADVSIIERPFMVSQLATAVASLVGGDAFPPEGSA